VVYLQVTLCDPHLIAFLCYPQLVGSDLLRETASRQCAVIAVLRIMDISKIHANVLRIVISAASI